MSQPSPAPVQTPSKGWNPGRRAWLWIAAAFALGVGLFAMLVMGGRDQDEFFRAPAEGEVGSGRVFQPLPAPLPGGESGVDMAPPSVMPEGEAEVVEAPPPRAIEAPATMPSPDDTQAMPAPPVAGATPSRSGAANTMPRPLSSPQPAYPRQSLRAREQGTVRLRVDVGANGRVQNIAVATSSGSRNLDRAASNAVRSWRFEPARRNGEAVMGTVDVPIEFKLD